MLKQLLDRPLWMPGISIQALLIVNFTIVTIFGNLAELPLRTWQTWSVVAIIAWALIGTAINLASVSAHDPYQDEEEA